MTGFDKLIRDNCPNEVGLEIHCPIGRIATVDDCKECWKKALGNEVKDE